MSLKNLIRFASSDTACAIQSSLTLDHTSQFDRPTSAARALSPRGTPITNSHTPPPQHRVWRPLAFTIPAAAKAIRSARANSQASFTPLIHSLVLSLIGRGRFGIGRHQSP